jgi:hypothetical protein
MADLEALYNAADELTNDEARRLVNYLFVQKEIEPTDETQEQRFHRLVSEWREETAHLSSMTKMIMHPKYQSIIGMGSAILPILFRELQQDPDYWFWALTAITEQDPTRPEDAGDLQKMTASWLKWAREHGYL